MKKFYFIALGAALLISACDKTPVETEPVSGTITISPLLTRVSDLNFDEGDQIGLTISMGEGTNYVENAPLTFADNVFSGAITWYGDTEAVSDFIAYYPYNPAGAPETFTVQTDQSEGVSPSDLIIGTETGIKPTESAVGMTFRHKLTKIVVNMTNNTGSDITSVVLSGSKTTADVNVAEASVTVAADSETADITTCETENDKTYAAIIVPQEAALTVKVTTADATEYTQNLETKNYVSGGQYTVTAIVSAASGIQISVDGEIVDWTDEGEVGPGEGGDTPGGENTIEYGGVTYKTVTLSNGQTWMAEPLRYVPEGMTVSSDPAAADAHIWYPYSTDGTTTTALTDDASIAKNGYLYDMYAALGVAELSADKVAEYEGAQGICPDGWHIPTWEEYFLLCGKSNKMENGNGASSNTEALFYDSEYDGGKVETANELGWNVVFSGVRQKTEFTATNTQYVKTAISETNCTIEDFYGAPAMTYYISSTFNRTKEDSETGEILSIYFMSMMTTFTKTYSEGRLSMSNAHCEMGQQLRCIKDAE